MRNLLEKLLNAIGKAIKESYDRIEHARYSTTIEGPCKIYISDPCYILLNDYYDKTICGEKSQGVSDDKRCIFHGTYIGDGSYPSMSGHEYGVDAGVLCAYVVYNDDECKKTKDKTVYKVSEGPHKLTLDYNNGDFRFYIDNTVFEEIYTGIEEEEDYEEEDYEEEED